MPRRSHKPPEEYVDDIRYSMRLTLNKEMKTFVEVEAKRIGEIKGKKVYPTQVVRALIASYYEKRMAGLVVSPDD